MNAVVWRTALLVVATAVATMAIARALWAPAATAVLCAALCCAALFRLYRQNERKVSTLLDAVDNNDGSFRFSEKKGRSIQVNSALNRIAAILSRARADIVRQERYFGHILNVVNTGILVIGSEGHIERTNRRALDLLGMDACTHLRRIADASPELARLLADGVPGQRYQVKYRHGTTPHTLNLHISAVTIRDRQLRIAAIDDIDRELEAREIDAWSSLTRVLTHEIMNSLSPITSLSDGLLHGNAGSLPPDVRQGLETISATGRNLSGFIASYRRLAHPATPEPALFDVRPFLERMVSLACNFPADERLCSIAIGRCTPDLMLYADEGMISQVVLNLLKNAAHAASSADGGYVTVSAYATPDDEVVIEVSNNGPQIPAEIADRIFLPFFTTKPHGTGIGLSLSKQIMRASGGTISLLPYTADHTDTTFALTFR